MNKKTKEEFIMNFNDYCRKVSAAYWTRENEIKTGTHSSQIRKRIEKELLNLGVEYNEISFLRFRQCYTVIVYLDDQEYGTFDYLKNKFI